MNVSSIKSINEKPKNSTPADKKRLRKYESTVVYGLRIKSLQMKNLRFKSKVFAVDVRLGNANRRYNKRE